MCIGSFVCMYGRGERPLAVDASLECAIAKRINWNLLENPLRNTLSALSYSANYLLFLHCKILCDLLI